MWQGGGDSWQPRLFPFGVLVFDEIAYQFHMLEVWWYLHRDTFWFYQYYTQWPFAVGIVMGFIAGYYLEDVMIFFERHAGRRAMRRRIRQRQRERDTGCHASGLTDNSRSGTAPPQ